MTPSPVSPEFAPVEDLLLTILRRWFEGMDVYVGSEFVEGMPLPAVIARTDRRTSLLAFQPGTDDRFLRPHSVSVSVFCRGPSGNGVDADIQGSQLGESVTLGIRTALQEQWVTPFGHIVRIEQTQPFTREPDFQTSTTVVQYTSLPDGMVRYEAIYRLAIRPPVGGAGNPYVPH